jgi:CheY-like chemotaxis protein
MPGAPYWHFAAHSGMFQRLSGAAIMDNKPFTVLLVEDDLNDIFLVKRAFKLARIQNPLQVVTDGLEAINYLRGEGRYADREAYPLPKLMVLDIKMPRRTGFEVLEWIKGNSRPLRRIPVVIVSLSDNPADINRAYELGANAYMIKPMAFHAVEHLFESITHYWGLECAKPELEAA